MTDPQPKHILIHCDGLCEPRNPGGWACWAWLASFDGKPFKRDYGCLGRGPGMTNNEAEYEAVLQALQYCDTIRARIQAAGVGLIIKTDSQLVVKQVNGDWQINKPRAQVAPIRHLLAVFNGQLLWVPREQNAEADALTRLAYQQARRAA